MQQLLLWLPFIFFFCVSICRVPKYSAPVCIALPTGVRVLHTSHTLPERFKTTGAAAPNARHNRRKHIALKTLTKNHEQQQQPQQTTMKHSEYTLGSNRLGIHWEQSVGALSRGTNNNNKTQNYFIHRIALCVVCICGGFFDTISNDDQSAAASTAAAAVMTMMMMPTYVRACMSMSMSMIFILTVLLLIPFPFRFFPRRKKKQKIERVLYIF